MVADSSGPGARVAQLLQAQLRRIGIETAIRAEPPEQVSEQCGVPANRIAICPGVGWIPDFLDGQAMLDAPFNGASIVPEGNFNWPQLDDPAIDAAMARARGLVEPRARARAWGAIDRMITARAPAVPFLWSRVPLVESADVRGAASQSSAVWDLSYTSLR